MRALIDLLVGFIALLAAAALSQFGVDLNAPRNADREVHRVENCAPAASAGATEDKPARRC